MGPKRDNYEQEINVCFAIDVSLVYTVILFLISSFNVHLSDSDFRAYTPVSSKFQHSIYVFTINGLHTYV